MMRTTINANQADWTVQINEAWQERVTPLVADDESISTANYFTPRPYRNEYDRGSNKAGFVYTVQPGFRVCIKEWAA